MFWFILTILMVAVSSITIIIKQDLKKEIKNGGNTSQAEDGVVVANFILGFAIIIYAIFTLFGSFYTQDPGNASVLVSFSGKVSGIDYEQGFRLKAPWTRRVQYDIRNNTLSYVGSGEAVTNGGDASGNQITFQDKDGVTGNLDVSVRYSIRGDKVQGIYDEYKTQQEFVVATLENDVRSKTREIAAKYTTLELFNNRDAIKKDLQAQLKTSWDKLGVDVEEVYLQEVRYSDEVKSTFDKAQNARTDVETAKANQEKARIDAETNNIKTNSLSEAILREKLIDAIKNGNGTYIIDTDNISIGVK